VERHYEWCFSPTLSVALHLPTMESPETLLEHATWLRRTERSPDGAAIEAGS
jgi:hypothetical protein